MIFLSFSFPLGLLGLALVRVSGTQMALAGALFGVAVAARMVFHFTPRLQGGRPLFTDLWLVPVRDFLLCWHWCRSFFTSRIVWRGNEFDVDADGFMRRLT